MERKIVGCAGYTNEQYKAIVNENIGKGFSLDKVNYTNRYCTITITCEKHGDFEVKANSLLVRRVVTPCKACHAEKWVTNFIIRSDKKHGNKYDYSKVVFPENDQGYKVTVICGIHGEFISDAYSHMQGSGGCLKCSKVNNRLPGSVFVARAVKVHGDKYDYSRVKYLGGRTHVEIVCPVHGIFKQHPDVHLAGSGCRWCFIAERSLTTEQFIEKAKAVHGDTYDYRKSIYVNSKKKIVIECVKHGEFTMTPNSHLACRQGCPRCKESKGETRIRKFLENNGIGFHQEYKINGSALRFDFMIPEKGIVIEFQGQQHFKPIEVFGGVDAFRETVARDRLKQKLAAENGLVLLRPSFKQLKGDRLERYLTRHLLNNEPSLKK